MCWIGTANPCWSPSPYSVSRNTRPPFRGLVALLRLRKAKRDVCEDFALVERENPDRAGWARDHEECFTPVGEFDPEMELICERLRLVEVLGTAG